MNVVRASVLGYCMGVERAVQMAETVLRSLADGEPGARACTLGPLIHNPRVLRSLEERGCAVLAEQDAATVPAGTHVIVRAHGTTPSVLAALSARNAVVHDATCPRVHLSQQRALEWSRRGHSVIIAGDKDHGEVTSISGFAREGNPACTVAVIQTAGEARTLSVPGPAVLIAQTTFSPDEFDAIAAVLVQGIPALQVFRSICSATRERQEALRSLCGTVAGVLVIGGKNSANTRRLAQTAQGFGVPVALVESAAEIPPAFFGLPSVGLTAGASTPLHVVDEVEHALRGDVLP